MKFALHPPIPSNLPPRTSNLCLFIPLRTLSHSSPVTPLFATLTQNNGGGGLSLPRYFTSRRVQHSFARPTYTSSKSSNSFTSFLFRTLFTLDVRRNRRNPFPVKGFRTLARTIGGGGCCASKKRSSNGRVRLFGPGGAASSLLGLPAQKRRHVEIVSRNFRAGFAHILLDLLHDVRRPGTSGGGRNLAAGPPGLGQELRALLRGFPLHFTEARGNHGDLHGLLHGIVLHGAEDDVGVLVRRFLAD